MPIEYSATKNIRALVVKCTAGAEEPERCAQAFTVAATAVAAGATVDLDGRTLG